MSIISEFQEESQPQNLDIKTSAPVSLEKQVSDIQSTPIKLLPGSQEVPPETIQSPVVENQLPETTPLPIPGPVDLQPAPEIDFEEPLFGGTPPSLLELPEIKSFTDPVQPFIDPDPQKRDKFNSSKNPFQHPLFAWFTQNPFESDIEYGTGIFSPHSGEYGKGPLGKLFQILATPQNIAAGLGAEIAQELAVTYNTIFAKNSNVYDKFREIYRFNPIVAALPRRENIKTARKELHRLLNTHDVPEQLQGVSPFFRGLAGQDLSFTRFRNDPQTGQFNPFGVAGTFLGLSNISHEKKPPTAARRSFRRLTTQLSKGAENLVSGITNINKDAGNVFKTIADTGNFSVNFTADRLDDIATNPLFYFSVVQGVALDIALDPLGSPLQGIVERVVSRPKQLSKALVPITPTPTPQTPKVDIDTGFWRVDTDGVVSGAGSLGNDYPWPKYKPTSKDIIVAPTKDLSVRASKDVVPISKDITLVGEVASRQRYSSLEDEIFDKTGFAAPIFDGVQDTVAARQRLQDYILDQDLETQFEILNRFDEAFPQPVTRRVNTGEVSKLPPVKEPPASPSPAAPPSPPPDLEGTNLQYVEADELPPGKVSPRKPFTPLSENDRSDITTSITRDAEFEQYLRDQADEYLDNFIAEKSKIEVDEIAIQESYNRYVDETLASSALTETGVKSFDSQFEVPKEVVVDLIERTLKRSTRYSIPDATIYTGKTVELSIQSSAPIIRRLSSALDIQELDNASRNWVKVANSIFPAKTQNIAIDSVSVGRRPLTVSFTPVSVKALQRITPQTIDVAAEVVDSYVVSDVLRVVDETRNILSPTSEIIENANRQLPVGVEKTPIPETVTKLEASAASEVPVVPAYVFAEPLSLSEVVKLLANPPEGLTIDPRKLKRYSESGTGGRTTYEVLLLAQRIPLPSGGFLVNPDVAEKTLRSRTYKWLQTKIDALAEFTSDAKYIRNVRDILSKDGPPIPLEITQTLQNKGAFRIELTPKKADGTPSTQLPVTDAPPQPRVKAQTKKKTPKISDEKIKQITERPVTEYSKTAANDIVTAVTTNNEALLDDAVTRLVQPDVINNPQALKEVQYTLPSTERGTSDRVKELTQQVIDTEQQLLEQSNHTARLESELLELQKTLQEVPKTKRETIVDFLKIPNYYTKLDRELLDATHEFGIDAALSELDSKTALTYATRILENLIDKTKKFTKIRSVPKAIDDVRLQGSENALLTIPLSITLSIRKARNRANLANVQGVTSAIDTLVKPEYSDTVQSILETSQTLTRNQLVSLAHFALVGKKVGDVSDELAAAVKTLDDDARLSLPSYLLQKALNISETATPKRYFHGTRVVNHTPTASSFGPLGKGYYLSLDVEEATNFAKANVVNPIDGLDYGDAVVHEYALKPEARILPEDSVETTKSFLRVLYGTKSKKGILDLEFPAEKKIAKIVSKAHDQPRTLKESYQILEEAFNADKKLFNEKVKTRITNAVKTQLSDELAKSYDIIGDSLVLNPDVLVRKHAENLSGSVDTPLSTTAHRFNAESLAGNDTSKAALSLQNEVVEELKKAIEVSQSQSLKLMDDYSVLKKQLKDAAAEERQLKQTQADLLHTELNDLPDVGPCL